MPTISVYTHSITDHCEARADQQVANYPGATVDPHTSEIAGRFSTGQFWAAEHAHNRRHANEPHAVQWRFTV